MNSRLVRNVSLALLMCLASACAKNTDKHGGDKGGGDSPPAVKVEAEPGRSAVAAVSAPRASTHCRISKHPAHEHKVWFINAIDPDELLPTVEADFEIVKDYLHPAPGHSIAISESDLITFSGGAGSVSMKHTDKDGKPIGSIDRLRSGTSNLWAHGVAKDPTGKPVGEYYLYRLADYQSCRHRHVKSPPYSGGPCRSLHFEYFDENDGPSKTDLPVLGANVKESTEDNCGGDDQTDEGDGDEGPITPPTVAVRS